MSNLALKLIHKAKNTKATFLDLGKCGLTEISGEILNKLLELKHLECLIFSNRIYSYSKSKWIKSKNKGRDNLLSSFPKELSLLPNLKHLFCGGSGLIFNSDFVEIPLRYSKDYWKIKSLDGLESFKSLKTLYLGYNEIELISEISKLNRLNVLELVKNQIRSIAPIKKLKSLEFLGLENNKKIKDYHFIGNLRNLKYLDLSSNWLNEINFLSKLTELSTLDLSYNEPATINPIKSLVNLKSINLSNTKNINDLSIIAYLVNLKSLGISNCNFPDLKIIENLKKLKSINTSSNGHLNFSHLPYINSLQSLNLSKNNIHNIDFINRFTNLKWLDLSDNEITDISQIQELSSLKYLDLSDNKIRDISPLAKLVELQYLNVEENQIINLNGLNGTINLQNLDARSNQIKDISGLSELNKLRKLNLNHNKISNANIIGNLINLCHINLSHNSIFQIQSLKKLTKLKSLYLNDNKIKEIDLKYLSGLKKLNLAQNKLTTGENLVGLTKLNYLNLSRNSINQIKPLSLLKTLKHLDISSNRKIEDIECIKKLNKLEILKLSFTEISNLKYLYKLSRIKHLDLSHNKIHDISSVKKIIQLPRLENLALFGNKIKYLPDSELGKNGHFNSLPNLRNYFEAGKKGYIKNKNIKILIVGNGCVGKTTLVKRLIDNPKGKIPKIPLKNRTSGIQIRHWDLTKKDNWFINFWDFGGQKVYHATHRLFLGSRTLYIYVWANKPPESKREPRYPAWYWMNFIASVGSKNKIISIQNLFKSETRENIPEYSSIKSKYEGYPFEFQFLSNHHLNARKKSRQSLRLKLDILDSLDQINEESPEKLPIPWVEVRDKIIELRDIENRKNLSWLDYERMCGEKNIYGTSIITIINWLHNSGEVYYKEGLFKDEIILDQEWIIKAIYSCLEKNSTIRKNITAKGHFTLLDARNHWNGYSLDEVMVFLNFMQTCKITFKRKENFGQTKFYIPQLLPKLNEKPFLKKWINKINLLYCRIHFAYLNQSLIDRFIVELQDFSTQTSTIWSNGIEISTLDGEALITVNSYKGNKNKFYLSIMTSGKKRDASLLHKIINKLNQIEIIWNRFDFDVEYSLDGKNFIKDDKINTIYENIEQINNASKATVMDGKAFKIEDYSIFIDHEKSTLNLTKLDMPKKNSSPLKVFVSYSKRDTPIAEELDFYLKQFTNDKEVIVWRDSQLKCGIEWDPEIKKQLQEADIIVLLISLNFLSTQYIMDVEITKAMNRHDKGEAKVMPLIISKSNWGSQKYKHINRIQAIPAKGKTLNDFMQEGRSDIFWNNVVRDFEDKLKEYSNIQ